MQTNDVKHNLQYIFQTDEMAPLFDSASKTVSSTPQINESESTDDDYGE